MTMSCGLLPLACLVLLGLVQVSGNVDPKLNQGRRAATDPIRNLNPPDMPRDLGQQADHSRRQLSSYMLGPSHSLHYLYPLMRNSLMGHGIDTDKFLADVVTHHKNTILQAPVTGSKASSTPHMSLIASGLKTYLKHLGNLVKESSEEKDSADMAGLLKKLVPVVLNHIGGKSEDGKSSEESGSSSSSSSSEEDDEDKDSSKEKSVVDWVIDVLESLLDITNEHKDGSDEDDDDSKNANQTLSCTSHCSMG